MIGVTKFPHFQQVRLKLTETIEFFKIERGNNGFFLLVEVDFNRWLLDKMDLARSVLPAIMLTLTDMYGVLLPLCFQKSSFI